MNTSGDLDNDSLEGLAALPKSADLPLVLLTVLIIVTSLLGNSLILYTLFKVNYLRSISSYLVVNLAVIDFIISISIIPTVLITLLNRGWELGETMCVFAGFFDAVLTKAQIMALLNIGINRFNAVHRPTFYTSEKNKSLSKWSVIIGWLYAFAWSFPPIFGLGTYSYQKNALFCGLDRKSAPVYGAFEMSLGFVVPGITGLVIYISVLVGVFRHIRQVAANLADNLGKAETYGTVRYAKEEFEMSAVASKVEIDCRDGEFKRKAVKEEPKSQKGRSRRKTIRQVNQDKQLNQITKAFLIIVLTFAICWFPRGIANTWSLIKGRSDVPFALEICSTLLIFTTAAVNPIVYGYYRTDLRNGFKEVLCCTQGSRQ